MNLLIILSALTAFSLTVQAQTKTRTVTPPPTYSFASNTVHEVVITPSRVSVESYEAGEKRTDLNIYAAYNRHLQDNIQVGGEGGLLAGTDTNGKSKTLFAAMGVFTYNMDANLRDAFFAQAAIGVYPAFNEDDGVVNESNLSFFAGVGKRFEMWGKINYMPYARAWVRGDEDPRFEIQALNFSIFY